MMPDGDLLLWNFAVREGIVSAAQLEECRAEQERLQREGGTPVHLLALLEQKGYLTAPSVSRLLDLRLGELLVPRGPIAPAGAGDLHIVAEPNPAKTETEAVHSSDSTCILPESVASGTPGVAPAFAPVGEAFGRYRLLKILGRGGMGVVYQAWDGELNRVVALKTLHAEDAQTTAEEVARFLGEARSAGRLRHPNIVPVHDVGTHAGRHYFTMDFIEGESLETAKAGLPLRPFLEVIREVALALHAAHQAGVVHRDVKPANILLDAAGRCYVTDFGLAKEVKEGIAQRGMTATGAVLGTVHYMAPEQAQGRVREIGPASDQWSLGVILYHRLAGCFPFDGPTLVSVVMSIVDATPDSPARVAVREAGARRVHRDLETLCLRCLEKDPRRRYASAGELAADLGRFLDGEPIQARPVSFLGRIGRRGLKQKSVALLSAGVMLLAGILAVYVPQSRRQAAAMEGARRRAETERAVEQVLLQAESTWREAKTVLYRPGVPIACYHEKLAVVTRLYDRALALAPDYGWIYESRGRVRMHTGDLVGAEADLRQAIAWLGPEQGRLAHRSLGRVYVLRAIELSYYSANATHFVPRKRCEELNRLGLAELEASQGAGDFRGTPEEAASALRIAEGRIALGHGRRDEAVRIFQEGVEKDSDEECAWLLAVALEGSEKEAWLRRSLELRPRFARALDLRANLRKEAGDLAGAVADYDRALEIDPRFAVARLNRGELDLRRKDLDAAVADFTKALECDPSLAQAGHNLGLALKQKGDLVGAMAAFDRTLAIDPEFSPAYEDRGSVRWERNDLEGALADYAIAVRLDPGSAVLRCNRAELLWKKGDLVAAAAEFEEALRVGPEFYRGHFDRGRMRASCGDVRGALDDFREAARLAPGYAAARFQYGRLLGDVGDPDGGIIELTEALRLEPDLPFAAFWRGVDWMRKDDNGRAVADFTDAIRLDPRDPDAYCNRAVARIRMGDFAAAEQDAGKALEVAPADWPQRGVAERLRADAAHRMGK